MPTTREEIKKAVDEYADGLSGDNRNAGLTDLLCKLLGVSEPPPPPKKTRGMEIAEKLLDGSNHGLWDFRGERTGYRIILQADEPSHPEPAHRIIAEAIDAALAAERAKTKEECIDAILYGAISVKKCHSGFPSSIDILQAAANNIRALPPE